MQSEKIFYLRIMMCGVLLRIYFVEGVPGETPLKLITEKE